MTDTFTKKAKNYLKASSGDLQTVFTKIKALEEINQRVKNYLSPEIKKYCQVANFTTNRLIILAANGSIATQLRFQTADLLQKFKQDQVLQKYQDIQCKVRPSSVSGRGDAATRKVSRLSTETAAIVRHIAESLEDSKLKEVLERIAGHTEE